MNWQYTPYTPPLFISVAVSTALAAFAWRRRSTPGARTFALLMLCVAGWSLGYALELGSPDLATKLFWSNLNFVGIAIIPPAWLVFALRYTGRDGWLTRRNLSLLVIEPLFVMFIAWTDSYHHLFRTSTQLITLDSLGSLVLVPTYGVGFWLHAAYAYALIGVGTVFLARGFARSPYLYRGQLSVLYVGVLAPWIANALYIFGLSPYPYLDLTPFAFTLTGLTVAWGLFRYRLLDLLPLARDALIEEMSDGVIVLDMENRVVDLNPAAQRVIGLPTAKAIGQDISQMITGWPDQVKDGAQRAEHQPEINLGEGPAKQCYNLRMSPLYDRYGNLIGRIAVLQDVTEAKHAETALRDSEERFRLLAENFQDGMIIYDQLANQNVYVNPAAARILGTPLDEILDSSSDRHFLHLVHEDDLSAVSEASRLATRAREQGQTRAVALEFRIRRPDGEVRWIRQRSYPFLSRGRLSAQTVTLLSDITERKQAEQEREKLIEELGAYASTVAHDLKNPLSLLIVMAETLALDFRTLHTEQIPECLREIVQQGRKMSKIIDSLLSLARVRNEEVVAEPLDMVNIVHEALLQLMAMIEEHQAEIIMPVASEWPVALGYAPWVEEVWVNYLSNAIKYGGRPPRLELGASLEANSSPAPVVHFWVRDNGPGLNQEQQALLFTAFPRLGQGETAGHGLGLSIVRRIAEKLGGQVSVESSGVPGEGSVFSFTLPADPGQIDRFTGGRDDR